MKPCKKVSKPQNLLYSILFFCVSVFFLQAQSNMPDDSYTTITKASSIALENPRKSLDMLRGLKQKFIEQGSYENIDDFSVYYTIIAAETSIYSREKRFAPIFRAWQEIGEKIKPLRTKDDQYASYFAHLHTKLSKNTNLYGYYSLNEYRLIKIIDLFNVQTPPSMIWRLIVHYKW